MDSGAQPYDGVVLRWTATIFRTLFGDKPRATATGRPPSGRVESSLEVPLAIVAPGASADALLHVRDAERVATLRGSELSALEVELAQELEQALVELGNAPFGVTVATGEFARGLASRRSEVITAASWDARRLVRIAATRAWLAEAGCPPLSEGEEIELELSLPAAPESGMVYAIPLDGDAVARFDVRAHALGAEWTGRAIATEEAFRVEQLTLSRSVEAPESLALFRASVIVRRGAACELELSADGLYCDTEGIAAPARWAFGRDALFLETGEEARGEEHAAADEPADAGDDSASERDDWSLLLAAIEASPPPGVSAIDESSFRVDGPERRRALGYALEALRQLDSGEMPGPIDISSSAYSAERGLDELPPESLREGATEELPHAQVESADVIDERSLAEDETPTVMLERPKIARPSHNEDS